MWAWATSKHRTCLGKLEVPGQGKRCAWKYNCQAYMDGGHLKKKQRLCFFLSRFLLRIPSLPYLKVLDPDSVQEHAMGCLRYDKVIRMCYISLLIGRLDRRKPHAWYQSDAFYLCLASRTWPSVISFSRTWPSDCCNSSNWPPGY